MFVIGWKKNSDFELPIEFHTHGIPIAYSSWHGYCGCCCANITANYFIPFTKEHTLMASSINPSADNLVFLINKTQFNLCSITLDLLMNKESNSKHQQNPTNSLSCGNVIKKKEKRNFNLPRNFLYKCLHTSLISEAIKFPPTLRRSYIKDILLRRYTLCI